MFKNFFHMDCLHNLIKTYRERSRKMTEKLIFSLLKNFNNFLTQFLTIFFKAR